MLTAWVQGYHNIVTHPYTHMQPMQEDHRKPKPKLGFVTKPMGLNILFHNEFNQALDEELFAQTYWCTTAHAVHTPLIPTLWAAC